VSAAVGAPPATWSTHLPFTRRDLYRHLVCPPAKEIFQAISIPLYSLSGHLDDYLRLDILSNPCYNHFVNEVIEQHLQHNNFLHTAPSTGGGEPTKMENITMTTNINVTTEDLETFATSAIQGDLTPYGLSKKVNEVLTELEIKNIPSQMMYNYVKNNLIPSFTKDGKVQIRKADAVAFLVKYISKKVNK
jgi:hypothetical protein